MHEIAGGWMVERAMRIGREQRRTGGGSRAAHGPGVAPWRCRARSVRDRRVRQRTGLGRGIRLRRFPEVGRRSGGPSSPAQPDPLKNGGVPTRRTASTMTGLIVAMSRSRGTTVGAPTAGGSKRVRLPGADGGDQARTQDFVDGVGAGHERVGAVQQIIRRP